MKNIENEVKEEFNIKLDWQNGYAQVINKGEKVNRLYGKWDMLRYLIGRIE